MKNNHAHFKKYPLFSYCLIKKLISMLKVKKVLLIETLERELSFFFSNHGLPLLQKFNTKYLVYVNWVHKLTFPT